MTERAVLHQMIGALRDRDGDKLCLDAADTIEEMVQRSADIDDEEGLFSKTYPLPIEHYERTARNLANLWSNGNDGARTCILAALLRAATPADPTRSAAIAAEPVLWESRTRIDGEWTEWKNVGQAIDDFKAGPWRPYIENGTVEIRALGVIAAPANRLAFYADWIEQIYGDLPTDKYPGPPTDIVQSMRHDAAPTASPEPPKCKTIYVKPLRTLVPIDERFADQIRDLLNASPEPDAVREALRHLSRMTRTLLSYTNPCNLPEDYSQQWQAVEHQCDKADAALSRPAHGGWEDISTAPKDREILAVRIEWWEPENGNHRWIHSQVRQTKWDAERQRFGFGHEKQPTHWTEVPAIPALPIPRNQGEGGGPRS